MGKTQLPPGFRFHPTDVELVRYYLKRKVLGKKLLMDAIAEVDIYKFEPPDLPDKSYIMGGDRKWHFFCPKEKKYATGVRANRSTECGYWKTTGKERPVLCNAEVVGKIKTLVYHFGKSPRGERTDWVMHEYRLEDKALSQMNVPQDNYVVCVVFKKDGPGPRNGAQYGAPFREEDWSDEEEQTDVLTANNPTNLNVSDKETNLVVDPLHDRHTDFIGGMFSESCVSDVLPAATTTTTSELPHPSDAANTPFSGTPLLDFSSTAILPETQQTPVNGDNDIDSMLEIFADDVEWLPFSGLNNIEVRHDPGVSAPVCLEGDIFNDKQTYLPGTPSYDLVENSVLFLELQDLTAPLTGNLSDSRSASFLSHQDHVRDLTDPITPQNGNLNDWRSSYLDAQDHVRDLTAPVTPQNGNLSDGRSSYLNLQDYVRDHTASVTPQNGNLNDWRSSYLNHQGPFGFSSGNDDPYDFAASMRRGPEPDM